MWSPFATSTEAPTTCSCVMTRWTIASRSAVLRSAAECVACTAFAPEQRSNKAIAERAGFGITILEMAEAEMAERRMAGDYRHERCQLPCTKTNPTMDEHGWPGFCKVKSLN